MPARVQIESLSCVLSWRRTQAARSHVTHRRPYCCSSQHPLHFLDKEGYAREEGGAQLAEDGDVPQHLPILKPRRTHFERAKPRDGGADSVEKNLGVIADDLDVTQAQGRVHGRLQRVQQRLVLGGVVRDGKTPLPVTHLHMQDNGRAALPAAPGRRARCVPPQPRLVAESFLERANSLPDGRLPACAPRVSLLLLLSRQGRRHAGRTGCRGAPCSPATSPAAAFGHGGNGRRGRALVSRHRHQRAQGTDLGGIGKQASLRLPHDVLTPPDALEYHRSFSARPALTLPQVMLHRVGMDTISG